MSGDKEHGQTSTAEPLVLLVGKAGHELLTGARSNEVKMSHLAPCSSDQTTALIWTPALRPRSGLPRQQGDMSPAWGQLSVFCFFFWENILLSALRGRFLNAPHTSVSALSTPRSAAASVTHFIKIEGSPTSHESDCEKTREG